MPSLIYNSFLLDWANGDVTPGADTFKVLLVTSEYAEDKDAHTNRADVTNEVVGTGYIAGGNTVAATVSLDTATDRLNVELAATTWTTSTITARKAVYYKSRGGAAVNDELVAVKEFSADVTTEAATFSLPAFTVRIQN
jgi:hypothetical protein